MKISIVIPTFNESENLKQLIPKIFGIFKEHKIDGMVVVVDDNSPDGTAKVAESFAKKFNVELILRREKLGLGTAYLAGFEYAIVKKADVIMSMDADQSHNPESIPALVELIESGKDVAIGSRYIKGGGIKNWNFSRKLTSFGANFLAKILLGSTVNDNTSGYRAYKRKVLESMDFSKIKSNGYSFLVELLYNAKSNGYSVGETPIIFTDRKIGNSKLSNREILKFFSMVLSLFFERILRLFR